jgi:hypothetical protein
MVAIIDGFEARFSGPAVFTIRPEKQKAPPIVAAIDGTVLGLKKGLGLHHLTSHPAEVAVIFSHIALRRTLVSGVSHP